MDNDELAIGTPAIAALIGVSTKTVERLIAARALPAFRIGGRWALRRARWRELMRTREDQMLAQRVALIGSAP